MGAGRQIGSGRLRIERPERQFTFNEFISGKVKLQRKGNTHRSKLKNPFLEGGLQTIIGSSTRAFVARHPGISEKAVKKMIDEIAGFQLVNAGRKTATEAYARQTAEDIFKTRKIPVIYLQGISPKSEIFSYPGWGCNALCTALSAALRAKGIPAAFVRLNKLNDGTLGVKQGVKHTIVLFNIGKKQFIADPFEKNPEKRMIEFTPEMHARFAEMERQGLLAVGRDSWDLGITSHSSYGNLEKTSFFQITGKKY
jgi:hypothetical protein